MSKLTDRITETLMRYANNGSSDIVLPNWYHGLWEMDVMKVTGSEYLIEYEIKVSKSDFKADFKKNKLNWRGQWAHKHTDIEHGERANRFYFVVPAGLIAKEDVPKYAGLLYYTEYEYNDRVVGCIDSVKNAPVIHKKLFTNYREVAKKLSFREFYLRLDLKKMKIKHQARQELV